MRMRGLCYWSCAHDQQPDKEHGCVYTANNVALDPLDLIISGHRPDSGPARKEERNDVAQDPQALKRFRQRSIGASVKLADGFTSY